MEPVWIRRSDGTARTYIALYLTEDPASPSLAVAEYVPVEQRKRFQEVFQRYNQIPPASAWAVHSNFM